MNKKFGISLLCLFGLWLGGFSQIHLTLAKPEIHFQTNSFVPSPHTTHNPSHLSPTLELIHPRFVRENPRGFSYLCRLELEIEEKLPIGVWLNLGEWSHLPGNSGGNAHIKFKLLDF